MADGRWKKTAAGNLTAPYGYMETRLYTVPVEFENDRILCNLGKCAPVFTIPVEFANGIEKCGFGLFFFNSISIF